MKIVTATLILVLASLILSPAWAQHNRSPEVAIHMVEANSAGEWLDEGTLAEQSRPENLRELYTIADLIQ